MRDAYLGLDVLGLVFVVVCFLTHGQLLQKHVFVDFIYKVRVRLLNNISTWQSDSNDFVKRVPLKLLNVESEGPRC